MLHETPHRAKKQWQYENWKDKALSTGVTALAVGGYGWCLSQVFNPVALGLAGAWTAYKLAKDCLRPTFSEAQRQKDIEKDIANGDLIPVQNARGMENSVKQLAHDMGLSYTPQVFFLGNKELVRLSLDGVEKWFYEASPPDKQTEIEAKIRKNHDNYYAYGVRRFIATTPEALRKISDAKLHWILGHETAHLKTTDSFSPHSIGKYSIKTMTKGLFFASMPFEPILAILYGGSKLIKATERKGILSKMGSMLNHIMADMPDKIENYTFKKSGNKVAAHTANMISVLAITAATFLPPGIGLGFGLGALTKLGWLTPSLLLTGAALTLLPIAIEKTLNIVSRHIEKRADRNGLYHTRNPHIEDSFIPLKPPVLNEMSLEKRFNYYANWKFSTHPGPIERRSALMEAWEKMDEFEEPPATVAQSSLATLQKSAQEFRV